MFGRNKENTVLTDVMQLIEFSNGHGINRKIVGANLLVPFRVFALRGYQQ